MATEINVFDSDEFEQLVANRDLRISKALVETILKNLNGRKRHVHALSVLVEQEQTIYDITVDRKEFVVTLEQNLSILEKNEEYETCAEVVKAIKFLKEKKVKD
jgi:protein-arginine kinase activator protein McsA